MPDDIPVQNGAPQGDAPRVWQPGMPITEADLAQASDQVLTTGEGPEPKTTALGHAARTTVSELGPGAAAAAAFTPAFEAGTALGAETGPFAPVVGLVAGIGASALSAAGTAWAQHKAAQALAPETTEAFNRELEAGEKQHPVAGTVGRIAAALPMFEFSPLESVKGVSAIYKAARGAVLTDIEKEAAKATAAQVGLGTGQAVIQPLLFGDSPTKQGIAEAFVQSLLLGKPRFAVFGAHAEKAVAEENAAKDATVNQPNPVDNPASTYTPPIAPNLTADERAKLSLLAGKTVAGAPIAAEDAPAHRIMAGNEEARQFFQQEKQRWANEKTRLLALAAMERSDFGDSKTGPSDVAGGEMPQQGGTEFPVAETAPLESQPAKKPSETLPEPSPQQPVAETPPTPSAPVASPSELPYIPTAHELLEIPHEADEPEPPSASKKVADVVGAVAAHPVTKEIAKGTANQAATELKKEVVETPKAPVKPAVDWKKYQGDPVKFVDQFRDVVDSGGVNVAKAGTKVNAKTGKEGLGQKRASLYQDLTTLTPDHAKAEVLVDIGANKSAGAQSRKQVAMLSPDGSHVLVGTASETASGGKRTLKVSTYDIGVGRKSAGGEHYASSYDKMVEQGWKPLASLKSDKMTKGGFATYSVDQWRNIEGELRQTKSAAQRTTEAMMGHLEAAKEFGREQKLEGTADAALDPELMQDKLAKGLADENNLGRHEVVEGESEPAHEAEVPHFDQPHAEVIWDALAEHEPKSPADVIKALGDRNVFGAIEPLIHDLGLDPKKQSAEKIAGTIAKTIFEHYERARKETTGGGAERFTKSLLQESRGRVLSESPGERPVPKPVGAEPGRVGAPAGSEPGAGRVEAGADTNPAGGKAGAAQPDTGNAPAESPAHVEVADKDGLGPKETTKLNKIAETIARAEGHEGIEAIEERGENILEEGIAVKVNGESALLHDGVIHTQDGKQFPAPTELFADVAKFRKQQAVAEIERLRPTDFDTASVARAAIRGLRAAGIRVGVIIDPLAKHFATGEYTTMLNGKGNAVRVIQWHVADIHDPTVNNLVALFHEAGHAVYAKMPPDMQAALLRAVEAFSNTQLRIGNFQEAIAKGTKPENVPFVQQEGRLVESLARRLVEQHFNPAEARSVSQRIWQVIKDTARGVYMAFQKMVGLPISNERAMAYFEHRVTMALRGEQPMSLLNFLGGSRMKMPDWDDPNTTQKYSGINQVSNPRKALETKEGAPVGIAALNHFAETVMEMIHQQSLADTRGLTKEQIFRQLIKLPEKVGDTDLFVNGATPLSLIADAAKMHGVTDKTRIEDLPNEVARTMATTISHAMFSAMKADMAGASSEARRMWKSGAFELERNNDRLVRLMKDYVDIDYMADTAKKTMLKLVDNLSSTVRGIRDASFKEGQLGQVIQQLDESFWRGGDLPQPYRRALDEIHTELMNGADSKFADTLQHIAAQDIDWKLPAHDIAAAIQGHYESTKDPRLASLVGDTEKAKAFMATTIAFGKSNSHMMDMLALRSEKAGEERAKANLLLKDMLNANRDSLAGLKQQINQTFGRNQRMRDRMLRIAGKIDDLKARNKELTDSVERNKAMVDFHQDIFKPVMDQKMAALEKAAGIQLNTFEVCDGAQVPVPNHAGANPEQFTDRTLKLRSDIGKKGERPSPTPDVVKWMKSMEDWAANKGNTRYGAKYNEVVGALNKLKNHYVTDQHLNLKGSFMTKMFGPIQERCNQTGTPMGRLVGQAFNRYSSLLRAKVRDVVQKGTDFSAALNDARKACGYPNASETIFWDKVVAPALHELEQNGDRFWANAKNTDEMVNQAVAHALDFMNLPNAKARTAVEKLLRQHIANADMMVKNGAELGNKVLDQTGSYKIYRPVLGKAPFVMPRAITEIA